MNVSVKPGKYVVAVSGGVDSMLLLHVLTGQPGLELVVAHFDHGIRKDSVEDRHLVKAAAERYGLPFIHCEGRLGPRASEETARRARYAFLRQVQRESGARAIITAHHQDDVLETAVINMLRGTGRKGLSSLTSTAGLLRPLLDYDKAAIRKEAGRLRRLDPAFTWREDSTNDSDSYLRNYIRHHILKGLSAEQRQELLGYAQKAARHNPLIDGLLLEYMDNQHRPNRLNKYRFIMLPYDISCEVMAAWLRQNGRRSFDRQTINRLVTAAKVAAPGNLTTINAGFFLKTGKVDLQIVRGGGSQKQGSSV